MEMKERLVLTSGFYSIQYVHIVLNLTLHKTNSGPKSWLYTCLSFTMHISTRFQQQITHFMMSIICCLVKWSSFILQWYEGLFKQLEYTILNTLILWYENVSNLFLLQKNSNKTKQKFQKKTNKQTNKQKTKKH